jgi:hypothetical protein
VKDIGVLNKRGCNSCKLPADLPNLQKTSERTQEIHVNLNYNILVIVNGQVCKSKSENMSAISDKKKKLTDTDSSVSRLSSTVFPVP